jgi:ribokinase
MAKIVVVGSFNMDLTSYMERLPRPSETVHGSRFVTGPGGKGSNQAVAAARLGAQVTFVGRLGKDMFGDTAVELWQREGINTHYIVRDPTLATGVAPIFVEERTGENVIVVVLGANTVLSLADVDAAEGEIASADVLLTQLEIPLATVQHALELAKRHNVKTILNPAPAARLSPALVAAADYMTPNEIELDLLGGADESGSLTAYLTVEKKSRRLLLSDTQTLVVTLGAQGAQWVTRGDTAIIPAFQVKAVDTTGAGDAFNAGLAVGLAEGKPLDAAIRLAHATAALSVMKPGTAASMPTREEVDAFLQETARKAE